jgi:hypothetical protein
MNFIRKIMGALGFDTSAKGAVVLRRRPGTRPRPAPQVPQVPRTIIVDKPIEYILNDPTTPNLVSSVAVPKTLDAPKFAVHNYQGGGFPLGSFESQAANCVVTLSHTIEFLNRYTDKPINKWAATSSLSVFPRAGNNLNAYYDRKQLKFFYFSHELIGTIYTCDSPDVVSHELGHAVLDFYRPDMWSAAFLEVAAFHEAFGDFVAMMKSFSHDEVSNYAISQTGGDFTKENVVANMAEQMGKVIFKLSGPESGRSPNCLRCAINNFKYVNPGTLPEEAPSDKLAAECHSFARIFVGALYDIFVMIYNDVKSTGVSDLEAVHQARDTILRYVMKAIQFAPLNANFFESMSRTLLWTDVTLSNWKYHNRMQQIFFDRNMLTPQVRMLSAPTCDNEEGIVSILSTKHLKLGEHLIRAQSESNNPLYDVEVEIPQSQAHLYDNEKNLVDSIMVSEDESLSGAQDMISYLHKTNSVSDDPLTPFQITDGKLVRTHFI